MSLGTIKNVVKREAGGRVYFIGTMTSDRAKSSTFVPVVEESDTYLTQICEDGYQRPGQKSRMTNYRKYLVDHPERLIPPVILSARGRWDFEGDSCGTITLNGAAAIVDGQHRIGGIVSHYDETEEPIKFDFICFDDLTLEQEIEEFVTINGKQVGVSPALQAYLDKNPYSEIAWELNIRSESPFFERISRTKMSPDHLFMLHSLTKNITRMFNHGSFEDLSIEQKIEVVIKYWNCIKVANPEPWEDINRPKKEHQTKMFELTGNIAWSLIAPFVLLKGFAPSSNTFNWDEIQKVISFISRDIDWNKEGEFYGQTGEFGGGQIKRHLERALGFYNSANAA